MQEKCKSMKRRERAVPTIGPGTSLHRTQPQAATSVLRATGICPVAGREESRIIWHEAGSRPWRGRSCNEKKRSRDIYSMAGDLRRLMLRSSSQCVVRLHGSPGCLDMSQLAMNK